MVADLSFAAEELGIKYFLISFTDVFGVVRSKLVPAHAIANMEGSGAGFAGFAAHMDMTPADPDMFSIPDPDSLIQLPWKPEVGWLASDPYMNGEPVGHAPRVVLKRVLERARTAGYFVKSGVEAEYFVILPDGSAIADSADIQPKPCYDQQALMRRYDLISEICDYMRELDWGPYQNDHEDANGQFEMNWDYSDALQTADRHTFFKYMVKSIAENHGLRATFMPKPFPHLTGNGCHVHASVWNDGGENLFPHKDGELGLSDTAYHFIGGVLANAPALSAFTNPVVNSYKRINAPPTLSGATWSPNTITYGGNNRTHMIRIPDDQRIEIRLADGATNPYLVQAGYAAAGVDGIQNRIDPGKRLDTNMYTNKSMHDIPKLPENLLDSLRALGTNKILSDWFGPDFVGSYIKLKKEEWNSYTQHFTQWERINALDV